MPNLYLIRFFSVFSSVWCLVGARSFHRSLSENLQRIVCQQHRDGSETTRMHHHRRWPGYANQRWWKYHPGIGKELWKHRRDSWRSQNRQLFSAIVARLFQKSQEYYWNVERQPPKTLLRRVRLIFCQPSIKIWIILKLKIQLEN